jgi:hypothetical protein
MTFAVNVPVEPIDPSPEELLEQAVANANRAWANYSDFYETHGWSNHHRASYRVPGAPTFGDTNRRVSMRLGQGWVSDMPEYMGYYVNGRMVNGVPDGPVYMIGVLPNGANDPGNRIVGNIQNGKMEGLGFFVNSTETYFGQLKGGVFNGLGRYSDVDDNRWYGDWVDGNFSGYGIKEIGNFSRFDTRAGVFPPYFRFAGYFENGLMQGPGFLQAYEGLGTANSHVYRVYGIFKDSELVETLTYEDWSAELDQAFANIARGGEAILNAYNQTMQQMQDIWARSQANISTYRARLQASQAPPRVVLVPTYGLTQEERGVGQTGVLPWVVGR